MFVLQKHLTAPERVKKCLKGTAGDYEKESNEQFSEK